MTAAVAGSASTLWAAAQVLRQHLEEPAQRHDGRDPADIWSYPPAAAGRCAQCDGTDPACRLLVWAVAERRAAGITDAAGA